MVIRDVVGHQIEAGDIITYPVRKNARMDVRIAQVYSVRDDGKLKVAAIRKKHTGRNEWHWARYNTVVGPKMATWVSPEQMDEDLYFEVTTDPVHYGD